jgi:hypothetical protein
MRRTSTSSASCSLTMPSSSTSWESACVAERGIIDGHGWAFAGPLRGRRVHFDQIDELSITGDVMVLIGHCIREREPDAPVAGLPDGAAAWWAGKWGVGNAVTVVRI